MRKSALSARMVVTAMLGYLITCSPLQAIVTEQWAVRQAGFHDNDEVRGVAVDSAGNIYVGAATSSPENVQVFELLKYAPDGTNLWTSFFAGSQHFGAYLSDMARDGIGNVYMSGRAWSGVISQYDFIVIKVDPQGQQVWSASWNSGQPDNSEGAKAIALDDQGNVYATGAAEGLIGGEDDIVTIKYNGQGVEQWVRRYDGPIHETDRSEDVAVDHDGNVYTTGYSDAAIGSGYNYDIVTIKYNSLGAQQWMASFAGPGTADDTPIALAVDTDGNVCVGGNSNAALAFNDAVYTLKYSSAGILLWSARYTGHVALGTYAHGMTLDAENNVILTGYDNVSSQSRITTVKYTPSGELLWERDYQGPGSSYSYGYALTVDGNRNVYITGMGQYLDQQMTCLTIKYDFIGNLQWLARHLVDSLESGGATVGEFITVNESGDVITGGHICMGGGVDDGDIHTIKYSQPPGIFNVTMTPETNPLLIPAQGGSFNYTLLSTNGVMDSLASDYWWEAIYPGNIQSTPIPGFLQSVLPLGRTTINRTQQIPGRLAAGTYQYLVNSGDYPNLIWASDTITVIKLPAEDSLFIEARGDNFSIASPNPFNPTTVIRYQMPDARKVSLKVYDTTGRLVATLVDGQQEAGIHEVTFDGSKLASGVYIYSLTAGDYRAAGKMVLLK
jgi:hypothetical protein